MPAATVITDRSVSTTMMGTGEITVRADITAAVTTITDITIKTATIVKAAITEAVMETTVLRADLIKGADVLIIIVQISLKTTALVENVQEKAEVRNSF